jgi:site-specific recombinase XerD
MRRTARASRSEGVQAQPVQLALFEEEIVGEAEPTPAVASLPGADASSPSQVLPSPVTRRLPERLSEGVLDYLDYLLAMNRARHTRESFALDLKLLQQYLGDMSLTAISERDLRGFVSYVRQERHNNATSVRRKIASVKNFFSYLQRERAIPTDPALRLIYPEIFPALPEFLEDDQVTALLKAASEHRAWEALLLVLVETGLKRDEVVALGRTDIVLAPDERGESYLVVRETERAKRLRSRRLEIPPAAAAVLSAYLREATAGERFFDISPRGVNFIVETCGMRAHIVTRGPRLTPQTLRETFAVRQMRRMVADEDAQRAAGLGGETIAALMERHDRELLRLLGLYEEPESARKYRKLVRGWQDRAPLQTEARGQLRGRGSEE